MRKFGKTLYVIWILLFIAAFSNEGKSNTDYSQVFECKSFQEFQLALEKAEPESTLKLTYSFTADGTLEENFYKIRDALYEAKKNIVLDLSDAKNITYIPEKAFSHDNKGKLVYLTDIIFPKSNMTRIGGFAFRGCESFTSIIIPESVTNVDEGAFTGCISLTRAVIPKNVTSIGIAIFAGCINLSTIEVDENNSKYTTIDGNIYSKDTKTFIQYAPGKRGSFVIPNHVTSIEMGAFAACQGISDITIPNSVTSIGRFAFLFCNGLTLVKIPASVSKIGDGPFSGCLNLMAIGVSSGNSDYTSIDGNLYSKDKKIFVQYAPSKSGSFVMPEGVISINPFAFTQCANLTSISIPNSVTSIGTGAFTDCKSLTGIIMPNNVTSIGEFAFGNCSGLASVIMSNNIESIGNVAFGNCSSLTSIVIPKSITKLDKGVFWGCSSLKDITFEAVTPPAIGINTFYGNVTDRIITVPAGKGDVYRTAEGWSEYADIIKALDE